MDHKVFNKDPKVLVNTMESYFKSMPPDCSLYSHENYRILIHKELMYQTKFMRDMIKSVGIDSKIEIFCPSVSKKELEMIVDFFYKGKISCSTLTVVSQVSKTLKELFGFPLMQVEMSESKVGVTEIGFCKELKHESDDIKIKEESILNEENHCDPLELTEKENPFDESLAQENNHSPSLKCTFCEKDFRGKAKYSLYKHLWGVHKIMAKKATKKPFLCQFCNKIFKDKSQLNRHTLIHTDEKPHACQYCKLNFRQKSSLKSHEMKHTGRVSLHRVKSYWGHYIYFPTDQVNLCQKCLFTRQLTHNMTTDCSMIYKFSTRKLQEQKMSRTCGLHKLFRCLKFKVR